MCVRTWAKKSKTNSPAITHDGDTQTVRVHVHDRIPPALHARAPEVSPTRREPGRHPGTHATTMIRTVVTSERIDEIAATGILPSKAKTTLPSVGHACIAAAQRTPLPDEPVIRRRRPPRRPGIEAITPARSSGLTQHSRAFEPSLGTTTPRVSIRSIRRPAFAKPTRSLRAASTSTRNWLDTTSTIACSRSSRSPPMSASMSLLSPAPSAWSRPRRTRVRLFLGEVDDGGDLLVGDERALHADGPVAPIGMNSPSPMPMSFSAPGDRG